MEASRLGLLHLGQQPVHGKLSPGECCVLWTQGQGGADVVGPVPNIKHPLKGAAALLLPASQIVLEDNLLAHVLRTALAGVGVERQQNQTALWVEAGWVGEKPLEEMASPSILKPRLDEVHIGIRDHDHLVVLLVDEEVLEEGQESRCGWDLFNHGTDGVLRHTLFSHIGQHTLHVLIVVPFPVGLSQPVRKLLAWCCPHNGVITVFIDDGLVEVKKNQEAPG